MRDKFKQVDRKTFYLMPPLLRSLEAVCGEWTLVCMAWNLERLHSLKVAR